MAARDGPEESRWDGTEGVAVKESGQVGLGFCCLDDTVDPVWSDFGGSGRRLRTGVEWDGPESVCGVPFALNDDGAIFENGHF